MDFISFQSDPRKTPFAPDFKYILCETYAIDVDFNHISKLILEKEKEILATTKAGGDGYTNLGPNSLTSRFRHFNVFKWQDKELSKLLECLKQEHTFFLDNLKVPNRKLWMQCWANVMRKGEKIAPHIHSAKPDCYLGGHVMVQCSNTSTIYINPVNQINDPEEYISINEVGKITLFQNCIPHYTTKHEDDTERISIAFDLLVHDNNGNKNLIKFN